MFYAWLCASLFEKFLQQIFLLRQKGHKSDIHQALQPQFFCNSLVLCKRNISSKTEVNPEFSRISQRRLKFNKSTQCL